MSKYLGPRSAITLRMPRSLKQRIKRLAEARGLSVNAWIIKCFQKNTRKDAA